HCSLADWSKFVADQLKGARGQAGLLKVDTYKRLHSSPYSDPPYTPGGWVAKDAPGGLLLVHDGSNGMNYATAFVLPAKDIAILVVSNRGGDAGVKACHDARDAILKAWTSKTDNKR